MESDRKRTRTEEARGPPPPHGSSQPGGPHHGPSRPPWPPPPPPPPPLVMSTWHRAPAPDAPGAPADGRSAFRRGGSTRSSQSGRVVHGGTSAGNTYPGTAPGRGRHNRGTEGYVSHRMLENPWKELEDRVANRDKGRYDDEGALDRPWH